MSKTKKEPKIIGPDLRAIATILVSNPARDEDGEVYSAPPSQRRWPGFCRRCDAVIVDDNDRGHELCL